MDEEDEHFLSASHRKSILLSGTECHTINYLLTELARAVPGNIGPRSFSYGPSAARSVLSRPRVKILQYGPCTRLVRGQYCIPHSKKTCFPTKKAKPADIVLFWDLFLEQKDLFFIP